MKRQQAKLEEEQPEDAEEDPVNAPLSGIDGARQSPELDPDDQIAGDVGDGSASNELSHGSGDVQDSSNSDDIDDTSTTNTEHDIHEDGSEQSGQHEDPIGPRTSRLSKQQWLILP